VRLTGRQVLAGVVSLVVVAAIATGVVILGSPSEERARRLDRLRVSELEGLKTAVEFYHRANGRLPASLSELASEPGVRVSADPTTSEPYRYRTVSADEFELCATFERASEPQRGSGVNIWQHPAGAHCFTLKIDKQAAQ
jgi:hypothetical protein